MNIKIISLSIVFTSTGALAAGSGDQTELSFDSSLDIQHVVSVTPVPGSCQVEPATMTYIEGQAVTHRVTYKVMGTCEGGV